MTPEFFSFIAVIIIVVALPLFEATSRDDD